MVNKTLTILYFCFAVLGSNFDLVFKRLSTSDMAILSDGDSIPNMRFFTIALFVRANSSYKTGTLFSYSVPNEPKDTIVLSFTESQVELAIKNVVVRANFKLADNRWHYVGVAWNGITGNVYVYIDGPKIKEAKNVLKGQIFISYKVVISLPASSLARRLRALRHLQKTAQKI